MIEELPQAMPSDIEKDIVKKTEISPEQEILVQFKTDIDTSVGQYQIDTLTSAHNLEVTDTITENNIVVVTHIEDSSDSKIASVLDAFVSTTNSDESIDQKIEELKQDPRVAHVQKNFIYTLQSTNDPDFSKLW